MLFARAHPLVQRPAPDSVLFTSDKCTPKLCSRHISAWTSRYFQEVYNKNKASGWRETIAANQMFQ
jgi:hypothetical protein